MADRILYPTDPSDLDAPGQHEALIWQVFASHEIGVNAAAPIGGRQTISTAVTDFALEQPHLGAPQGVIVEPGSAKSLRVSWQPINGCCCLRRYSSERSEIRRPAPVPRRSGSRVFRWRQRKNRLESRGVCDKQYKLRRHWRHTGVFCTHRTEINKPLNWI